jgi:hypothetical protein
MMANLGTSNRVAVRYVAESVFGTTPATPTLTEVRYTGESISNKISTVQSNEIRSDRNTTDLVRVSSDASGDIQFELSAKSFDDLLEGALASTFSAPVAGLSEIKNGVELKSFTIQKHFQDLTAPVFQNFTGMRVGGLNLDFKTGSILTGSMSFMGLGVNIGEAQIAGATVVDSEGIASELLNAVTDVIEIKENGVTSTMVIKSMTMALNNNLRAQDAIGSLSHVGVALGKLDISGNIEVYFTDLTSYNRFVNGTGFSLSFKVQSSAGDYFNFVLPNVKFESAEMNSGGLDQDLMLTTTWRALYDSTEASMITIERYHAP